MGGLKGVRLTGNIPNQAEKRFIRRLFEGWVDLKVLASASAFLHWPVRILPLLMSRTEATKG